MKLLVMAPRGVRMGVLLLELGLVLLLAWLLAQFSFALLDTGQPVIAPATSAKTADNARPDLSRLLSFDPFSRQTQEAVAARVQAAPESSLKLDVFGLRAMEDGAGTAIVKTQDGAQKLVRVGDDVAPGIRLAGVYADRLEISRAGLREAIFLRPQAERAVSLRPAVVKPAPAPARGALVASLAALPMTAERREGRIIGFRLGAGLSPALGMAGLEAGDIILSANGSPLTSFERLQELAADLDGANQLVLELERRGERRQLALSLTGKK